MSQRALSPQQFVDLWHHTDEEGMERIHATGGIEAEAIHAHTSREVAREGGRHVVRFRVPRSQVLASDEHRATVQGPVRLRPAGRIE
jgi:hypothetical protein